MVGPKHTASGFEPKADAPHWSGPMKDLQATLASLSIFKALDACELASIAERVQWLSVLGGRTLISEGDESDDMFVVVSGHLGVFKLNSENKLELINQLESGATVGEMGLLSNLRRSATVVALRDTELIRLSKQVFEDLVNKSPKVMRAIAWIVTMRLRHALQSRRAPDDPEAKVRPANGIFRPTGDYWTIVYEDEDCLIKDAKGLQYLSCLLRYAGRDIHAARLVVMAERYRGSNISLGATDGHPQREEIFLQPASDEQDWCYLGDAGEMLDARAKTAYRRRLMELREELGEAKQKGDDEAATKAENEIVALAHELSRAVGFGGRDRRAASATEKARINVTRSIKMAVERIAENSPKLGSHFKRRVHTGTFCCYRPDPDVPIRWEF
jgi:CRP-like cAMP-binding protein